MDGFWYERSLTDLIFRELIIHVPLSLLVFRTFKAKCLTSMVLVCGTMFNHLYILFANPSGLFDNTQVKVGTFTILLLGLFRDDWILSLAGVVSFTAKHNVLKLLLPSELYQSIPRTEVVWMVEVAKVFVGLILWACLYTSLAWARRRFPRLQPLSQPYWFSEYHMLWRYLFVLPASFCFRNSSSPPYSVLAKEGQ